MAGFAVCLAAWWIAGLAEAGAALPLLVVPTVLFALGTAGYTAFLFAQCEGRDLWQGRLLLPVLLSQTVVAGGAATMVLDLFLEVPEIVAVQTMLAIGLGANVVLVVVETRGRHSRHVTMAIADLTLGAQRTRYLLWLFLVPVAYPLILLGGVPAAVGGICALIGLFAYEDAYVRAGQSVPLS